MVVPFFVSLSSFSRDDDDTTQQAERELFVVFVLVVFVFFSLVSFVMCEEKRRDKVPFFFALFILSLSLSL